VRDDAHTRTKNGQGRTRSADWYSERDVSGEDEKTREAQATLPSNSRPQHIGYHVEIIYLRLASPRLALRRIAARVRQGGHDVPKADALRRFSRSWQNFESRYRDLADAWAVYDNSSRPPKLIESGP
jgi:predicted ABC-type ATPase